MAERVRLTGEQVLARLQTETHARLRIYIGAAPGVGKTYSMIEDAHTFRRQGIDLVVGFVESHGRPDTEARIADLEVIPRRKLEYRGVILEDMDLDAILLPSLRFHIGGNGLSRDTGHSAQHHRTWDTLFISA